MVLAVLVLMLAIILAFFTRATTNRMISSSSASKQQTDILAHSVVDLILSDITHEIAAGSEADPTVVPADGRRLYLPRTVDTATQWIGGSQRISTAPSLIPERVAANATNAPASLIKQSLHGRPFFVEKPGTTNGPAFPEIPNRASAANSAVGGLRGSSVTTERWRAPGFATTNETIIAPDWIYIDRQGQTPGTFHANWADRSPGNANCVIGRFAYNMYDVGGLIDINVVGNLLPNSENQRRGRLHQVTLAGAPGELNAPAFSTFLTWRSNGDVNASVDAGALFDPQRTFLDVPTGSQAFVTRQDLIRYTERAGTPISPSLLPYLTTFSRELNTPSFAPEPNRPMWPTESDARALNPALPSVRFGAETTLPRGSDDDVTVPAGTPVFARRFPLPKLDALGEDPANAEDLLYYFGLEARADGSFRYVATSADGRIKRLDEVAAEHREPNFFEVLKAVITAGSLGRNAGNTYTIDQPRDVARDPQIIQIGANIADQWDENSYPTTIEFPNADKSVWTPFHGVENLPYINNFEFVGHRPNWDLNRFQVWMIFDVWNPHQNADDPPPTSEIAEFRIAPRSGYLSLFLRYQFTTASSVTLQGETSPGYFHYLPEEDSFTTNHDVLALNATRSLVFPNLSYENPTLVGGQRPASAGYNGGLLVADVPNLGPAVPEDPDDLIPETRARLNSLLEGLGREKLPPDGNGFYGAKPHNFLRLREASGVRFGDRLVFDLQYRRANETTWRTYQTIYDIVPNSNSPEAAELKGLTAGSNTITHGAVATPAEIDRVAYHGALGGAPPEDYGFYGWRNFTSPTNASFLAAMKLDPRTIRFGHSSHSASTLGTTIRQSTNTPSWPVSSADAAIQNNWRASDAVIFTGTSAAYDPSPAEAFQWMDVLPIAGGITKAPFGLIRNKPEGTLNVTDNPSRYRDRDGIIRPADGYLGTIPTANPPPASGIGSRDDRPLLLNRRFRTVAEMGYAFRDLPWKSLDFFSRNSGDLGLLDAFSLDAPEETLPLVAGKVNLNSAPAAVLQTLLVGTAKDPSGTRTISASEAQSIAEAVVAERQNGPFRDRGDLVARVLSPASADDPGVLPDTRKHEREAIVRTLSEIGGTRTWNFLLDVVVQTGQMTANADSESDFLASAETRIWVHLAIDRITGEVVDKKWETVNE